MAVVRNTSVGSGKITLDQKMLYGKTAKKKAARNPTLVPKYFFVSKYRKMSVPRDAKIDVKRLEYSNVYPGKSLSAITEAIL